MVNSIAPNTEPCGTPDVTGRICEKECPLVISVFNLQLETFKRGTADPIRILLPFQEYFVVHNIEMSSSHNLFGHETITSRISSYVTDIILLSFTNANDPILYHTRRSITCLL